MISQLIGGFIVGVVVGTVISYRSLKWYWGK